MDAENGCLRRWAREERIPEPLNLATSSTEAGDRADAGTARLPAKSADPGHEKFGVEEHALYDFRDYGLD